VRLLLAIAGLCLVAIGPAVARADDTVVAAQVPRTSTHSRVVLVSMPDPVFSATAAALGPWSIAVEATPESTPMSEAAASALAREHDATAVAWLDGDVLVIYDDLKHRVERRDHVASPGAAIDDAGAAAIALSIKTALRQPPRLARVIERLESEPPAEVDVVEPLVLEPERMLHVAARLGAGVPLAAPSPRMARASLRASYDVAGGAAIGLGAEGSYASDIEGTDFSGRYRDFALTGGLEWRLALSDRVWLIPSLAGTIHLTRLRGDVTDPMERPIDRSSFPFGAEAELAAETGGHLRAGAALFGTFLTGRDEYKVHGEDVLRVPAVTVGIALRISLQ